MLKNKKDFGKIKKTRLIVMATHRWGEKIGLTKRTKINFKIEFIIIAKYKNIYKNTTQI